MVLPQTDAVGARVVAERCRLAVERSHLEARSAESSGPAITVSLGIATFPDAQVKNAEDLIRVADEALYASKRGGRNRVSGGLVK